MPIVEESYRDQFWGAKPIDGETLVGMNILGRLLVELRERLRNPEAYRLLKAISPATGMERPLSNVSVKDNATPVQSTLPL